MAGEQHLQAPFSSSGEMRPRRCDQTDRCHSPPLFRRKAIIQLPLQGSHQETGQLWVGTWRELCVALQAQRGLADLVCQS